MQAKKNAVIYRPEIKAIVGTIEVGDNYYLASTDARFGGTLAEFKAAYPEYRELQDVIQETLKPQ